MEMWVLLQIKQILTKKMNISEVFFYIENTQINSVGKMLGFLPVKARCMPTCARHSTFLSGHV